MSRPTSWEAAVVRARAHPLTGAVTDYESLMELVGDRRLVLIGEASHGSHEFYRERAVLTKRLIAEKGFDGVAIEGDWPEADRVHRYVRGLGGDSDAADALKGFRRFPAWMSRNADVRRRTACRPRAGPAGPSTIRDSTNTSTRPATHTSSRFSVPSTPSSGRVTSPPITEPRIPPAAKIGNRRLAWRVSTTAPATPHR